MKLTAEFKPQIVAVSVNAESMGVTIGTPVAKEFVNVETYTGANEVTPSSEMQTLNTAGFRLTQNIVVNPVPSNYGLITWNGAFLTVS